MPIHQLVEVLNTMITETETETKVVGHVPVDKANVLVRVIDGVPVTLAVYNYATALRKAMPGVKFGCDDELNWSSNLGFPEFRELWVYYPGQEYALGYIGHGDYSITEANNVFIVYSRKVANGKINSNRKQHYMLQSANMDKAIKNAKRVLMPYTNQEVANQSITSFANNLREVVDEAASEAHAYIRKCRDEDVITKELRNLIGLGVNFVTPEFQAAATHFLTAEAEVREKKTRLQGAYFIRMYERFDGMHADILTFDRTIKDVSPWSSKGRQPVEQITLRSEDLPEDIQMKIATLSMMDADTYVPLVGLKVTATSFWIEREVA